MISISDKKLMVMLRELGIKDPSPYKKVVYDYSEPSEKENSEFLKRLDDELYSGLENFGGKKHHYITGEIGCMASPKYLSFCEKKTLKYHTKPNIGCNINRIFASIGIDNSRKLHNEIFGRNFFKAVKNVWKIELKKEISWQVYLYAFYELGDIINLYGLPKEKTRIHFMVFGEDQVYLQDKHKSGDVKYMWSLKDKSLKRFLEEKVIREYFKPKYYLSPHLFKQFINRIHDPIALQTLLLLHKKGTTKGDLESRLRKIDKDWNLYIKDLMTFGFIEIIRGTYKISQAGLEYLKLILEGNR